MLDPPLVMNESDTNSRSSRNIFGDQEKSNIVSEGDTCYGEKGKAEYGGSQL